MLRTLERPAEFLHADELKSPYSLELPRPAVLEKYGGTLVVLIDPAMLETCTAAQTIAGPTDALLLYSSP